MREAGSSGRVDGSIGSEAEQHSAFEAVTLAEKLAEHRHRFLAAIFLVAGQQDDVFSLRRTGGFINGMIGGTQAGHSKGGGEERKDELFHDGWRDRTEDETYAHFKPAISFERWWPYAEHIHSLS